MTTPTFLGIYKTFTSRKVHYLLIFFCYRQQIRRESNGPRSSILFRSWILQRSRYGGKLIFLKKKRRRLEPSPRNGRSRRERRIAERQLSLNLYSQTLTGRSMHTHKRERPCVCVCELEKIQPKKTRRFISVGREELNVFLKEKPVGSVVFRLSQRRPSERYTTPSERNFVFFPAFRPSRGIRTFPSWEVWTSRRGFLF